MSSPEGPGDPDARDRQHEELDAGPAEPTRTEPDRYDWEHPDFHGERRPSRGPRRKHHKWYRPRNVVLIIVALVLVVVVGFALYLNAQLAGIRRAPFLAPYGGQPGAGTNILLVGSDAPQQSLALDQRTAVIQLVHLSADGRQAAMVHLPNDLFVRSGVGKHARQPLIAGYAHGGNPELVETLQADLGIRIDHVVQVAFGGYARVTDRLGGVDLGTNAGTRHFTGPQALKYSTATDLPNGDIDNGRRNQHWLRGMLDGAITPSVLLDPFEVVGLLHDSTPNIVVDDTFTTGDMRHLLWSSRHLRPDTIRFMTAPYTRFAKRPGVGRVLLPDNSSLQQLGLALRTDDPSGIASFDD